jgi:protein-tyrosine phosphatase
MTSAESGNDLSEASDDVVSLPPEFRQRWMPLAGTWNVRHVGGYVTSDGGVTRPLILIRADSLDGIDDEARAHLRSLGIRTIIDLRSESEQQLNAGQVIGRTVHLPILDVTPELAGGASGALRLLASYQQMLENGGDAIASAFHHLARDDALPGLVHCAAGKDRTGLVIALILSVVGVPDESVALDYAATGYFLTQSRRAEMTIKVMSAYGVEEEVAADLLLSDPTYMIQTLAFLRQQYGSVETYLLTHGVLPAEITSLRQSLVEGAPR